MDNFDAIPRSVKSSAREVIYQVCLSAVDISQCIIDTLAIVQQASKGVQIISSMESNGRLSSWIQNIVNLTVDYRVKSFAAIDDFRFLIKSSETSAEVFCQLEAYAHKIVKEEPKLEIDSQKNLCEKLDSLKLLLSKPLDLEGSPTGSPMRLSPTRLEEEYMSEQSVAEKYSIPISDTPNIEISDIGQIIAISYQSSDKPSLRENQMVSDFVNERQFHSFGGDKPGPVFTKKDSYIEEFTNLKKLSLQNISPIDPDEDENPFSPKGIGMTSSPRDPESSPNKKPGNDSFYGIDSEDGNKDTNIDKPVIKDDDSYSIGSYDANDKAERKNSDVSFGSDTGNKTKFDDDSSAKKDPKRKISYESDYSLGDEKEDKVLVEPIQAIPIPKYKQVEDPAIKKTVEPTKLQKAIKLGRSIPPLEDQGRNFMPVPFKLPSEEIARKYLTDYTTKAFELKDRNIC
jgi:hypothetical protein